MTEQSPQKRLSFLGPLAAVLFMLALLYQGLGYYRMFIKDEYPGDLHKRWREQHSIIKGATQEFDGRNLDADEQQIAYERYGFRVEGNPANGGYPPWAFALGYLLYWPERSFLRIWFGAINLLASVGIVYWLRPAKNGIVKGDGKDGWILATTLCAINSFNLTLAFGQFGIICVVLLVGCLLLANATDTKSSISSGLLLGLAMTKPNLAIPFLLPYLIRRRWLTLFTCVIYMLVASVAIWWLSGVDPVSMISYVWGAALHSANQGDDAVTSAVSIGLDRSLAIGLVASVVGGISLVVVKRMPPLPWLEMFAFAGVVARLWTYHRSYDNIILLFLLLVLAIQMLKTKRMLVVSAYVLVGMSLWIPSGIQAFPYVISCQMLIWIFGTCVMLHTAVSEHQNEKTTDPR